MSMPATTRTQLCPMENLGVVPMFTSVTLSFSPGLALISVMLNFIVSLPVISMARPSCATGGRRRGRRRRAGSGRRGDAVSDGVGDEQPPTRTARMRANGARCRGHEVLHAPQSRPVRPPTSLSQRNNRTREPGTGNRGTGNGDRDGLGRAGCLARRSRRAKAGPSRPSRAPREAPLPPWRPAPGVPTVCARAKTRRTAARHTRHMTTRRVLILLLVVMAVTVAVARTRQAAAAPAGCPHLPRHGRGHRSPGRRPA